MKFRWIHSAFRSKKLNQNYMPLNFKNYCYTIILTLTILLAGEMTLPDSAVSASARDKYTFGENCYNKLRKSSIKQKYRQFWLTCINAFENVYEHDPKGPWAAAGLYQSGQLYLELYKRSFKTSDREAGFDAFNQIIEGYPQSQYKAKAVKALKAAGGKLSQAPKASPAAINKMAEARKTQTELMANKRHQKYRDKWLNCINKYQSAYHADPKGPLAPEALYLMGELYMGLYTKSFLEADKNNGKKFFYEVTNRFPQSDYGEKAQSFLDKESERSQESEEEDLSIEEQKRAALDRIRKIIEEAEVENSEKEVDGHDPNKQNVINSLRIWSNPNYTRVVIDADRESNFSHRLLKEDPTLKKPQRLYVDLEDSRLGKDIERHIPINDNLLIDARAGQYTAKVVRVVVDIKSFESYKIFSLNNPFRIVVDVWGTDSGKGDDLYKDLDIAKEEGGISKGALARSLALGVRRIVIDPGHGGKDYGAPGYYKGIHEKDITLQIAKRLAKKVEQRLKCEVIMTRSTDKYLTLEERTAIANTQNADLFVSIHTNAARNRRAYGIETFFLNLATDDEAVLVAARENATSAKNISDLESILTGLMQNAKINESTRLAGFVQESLYTRMKANYSYIKSKGVKQAPFYVLLGAQMPAILVETSFISNARECKRLMSAGYQDQLCEGIINGIEKYMEALNPTAFFYPLAQEEIGG